MNKFEEYNASQIVKQQTLLQKFNKIIEFLKKNPIANLFYSHEYYNEHTPRYALNALETGDYTPSSGDFIFFANGYVGVIDSLSENNYYVDYATDIKGQNGRDGTISGFEILDAPSDPTHLTLEQYEKIKKGCQINGNFVGCNNPVFYPCKEVPVTGNFTEEYDGIYIGNRTTVQGTSVTIGFYKLGIVNNNYHLSISYSNNMISLRGIKYLNGKEIEEYENSKVNNGVDVDNLPDVIECNSDEETWNIETEFPWFSTSQEITEEQQTAIVNLMKKAIKDGFIIFDDSQGTNYLRLNGFTPFNNDIMYAAFSFGDSGSFYYGIMISLGYEENEQHERVLQYHVDITEI